MDNLTKRFTVTASTTLTAYIYRDLRNRDNKIVVGFSPHLSRWEPDETPHDVNEQVLRKVARKVALELASELSGLRVDQLVIDPNEGVGALTVVPIEGVYPKTPCNK